MLRLALPKVAALLMAGVLSLVAGGCDLRGALAKGQVDAVREADTGIMQHWDPELAGLSLPYGIIQLESAVELAPDYEPLMLTIIDAYVAYATGWVREQAHAAEIAGQFDRAEHLNRRAGLMYDRALLFAKRMLRLRDRDFDEAVAGGLDAFKKWLDYHFFDKGEDSEVLLTAGTAWLATMIASEEGLAAAADLPFARAVVERSVELDPELTGARGLSLLGTIECSVPKLAGGRPQVGLKLMQRAARSSERNNHLILVSMAEDCAVALQDRKLFHKLLMEVIEAGDVSKYRLSNKIARRRAGRLLAQMDEYFY
ncbi:MAG: TRAP transporter TatT component family protein [Proteobacteria bacterium]|nr:TRAP transporter TatT component family protein [Pseudomonadota bacterium]